MSTPLRNGNRVEDARLDALPQFDPMSKAYGVSSLALPTALKGSAWSCWAHLDQGREGACVGFAWSHELAAAPAVVKVVSDRTAQQLYHEAQELDQWEGSDYSGTSVLAGAKACQRHGFITGYRWAFSIDEALQALSHEGPVVFGLPWKDSMYEPREDGLLDCSGESVGRHAILGRGLRLRARLKGVKEPVVRLRNSWGADWGENSDAFVRVSDLEQLLDDDGECCVPLGRSR